MGLCSLDISRGGGGGGEHGENSGLETSSIWDPIPVTSPDGCVALGKELSLSEPLLIQKSELPVKHRTRWRVYKDVSGIREALLSASVAMIIEGVDRWGLAPGRRP